MIDAFNADMPFDQFVREQFAGDLLPARSLDDRRRQQVAASFLVLGNTNLEDQDKKQLVMDVVDEQLDTIGKAFLAQTLGCARCHDHKFDPIPTRDYYAMAGILRNVKTLEHANVSMWLEKAVGRLARERGRASSARERDRQARSPTQGREREPKGPHVAELTAELKRLKARGPKRETTLAVEELAAIEETRVNIRGSVHNLGESVTRGFLQVATVWRIGRHADQRERPSRARRLARQCEEPADGPGLRQPRLALALRRRDRPHPGQLRHAPANARATPSCSTIWLTGSSTTAGRSNDWCGGLCFRGPTGSRRRTSPGRSLPTPKTVCCGERIASASTPNASATRCSPSAESCDSRCEDPRFQPGSPRTSVTSPTIGAGASICPCFVMPCPRSSRCSTLPTRAWSPAAATSVPSRPGAFALEPPVRDRAIASGGPTPLGGPDLDDPARSTRIYRLALGRPPTERRANDRAGIPGIWSTAPAHGEETWAMLVQALFGSVDFRYR